MAQQMFSAYGHDSGSDFNQPVDGWDVSRVTNMQVRRI